MVIDFLQFAANFFILMAMLRLLQGRYRDTEWGKVLAFFG